MPEVNDDLINKVRAALAAATPGPWCRSAVVLDKRKPPIACATGPDHVIAPEAEGIDPRVEADAALIAAAPAWLAELCDEVETLRRTVSQVDDLYDCADAEKEYQLARAEAAEGRVAELEAELAVSKEYDSGLEDGRDDAKAEVERLRAAHAEEEAAWTEMQREYEDALKWRWGQIESLRAALRLIAALPAFPPRDIARRALGEGEP